MQRPLGASHDVRLGLPAPEALGECDAFHGLAQCGKSDPVPTVATGVAAQRSAELAAESAGYPRAVYAPVVHDPFPACGEESTGGDRVGRQGKVR
jgi:hypothetical protein